MNNKIAVLLPLFAILACAARTSTPTNVRHEPSLNIKDPEKVIERVIRTQPPALAIVPFEVAANPDCIDIRQTEKSGGIWGFGGYAGEARKLVCYNNIGTINLHYYNIWYIDILDKLGYYMYHVYSFDENDARSFIDSVLTMKSRL